MAVSATRGRRKKALLPGSLENGIKQGTHKTIGLALIAAAFMGWLSLISWSFSDPSLNHATDSNISNLLGKPGAIFADIFFQTIGLAAIFAMLPIAIQGVRMVLNHPVNMIRWRVASWPLSMVLIATTLTMFPRTPSWPLPQNYGGIIGDTMGKIIQLDALTSSSWLLTFLTFTILAACSVSTFCFTSNLKLRDAAILFQVEDPEQFKATLKAPLNRFGYWLRARQARNIEPGQNQRHWWRNANLDEPLGEHKAKNAKHLNQAAPHSAENKSQVYGGHLNADRQAGGLSIHAQNNLNPRVNQIPFSTKPYTPTDYQGQQGNNPNSPHHPPHHPPMSAKPLYPMPNAQVDMNAHYVDTTNGAPHMNQAHRAPAGLKPVKTQKSTLKPAMGKDPTQFILPPVELLNVPAPQQASIASHDELREMATMLEDVLLDFGVKGSILNVRPGPVVTLFEFEPARGIKTSRIVGLADDIARSMSAISARIAVIPGRNALGIELPNSSSEIVFLRDLVESNEFFHTEHTLPLILGRAIGGEAVVTDLTSMPHLLIAGTTGSGKSVGINTMLLSLLYRLSPKECRMIMIDPKMLELSIYDGIPHLLTPVVTDPSKAVSALKWAVREMEDRYRQMSKLGVRNIENFNERVKEANRAGQPISRTIQTGFDQQTGRAIFEEEQLQFEPMPMIVVVIDEMADLMMVAGKDIEATVQRLAQMARAAGIHVIMATQRPSVDVITGTIKANFPTRISFQVTSKIDSRTILGKEGAEQLLGHGDMLFMPGGSRMMRVHGAFVSDDEVERVVDHLRSQGTPEYLDNIILDEEELEDDTPIMDGNKSDDLFDEAVQIVIRDQKATISYLQRRLSIGYNKAATLIERMEEEGIIGPSGRGGKREIYGT